jgi:hypothetical protein
MESVSTGTTEEDLRRRRDGVLAIESLKEQQNTSVLEAGFNSIDALQKMQIEELERAYNEIRGHVEQNPQLRMQQVKQGQQVVMAQLSVDEAVRAIPEWRNFVAQHEAQYSQEFGRLIAQIKEQMK